MILVEEFFRVTEKALEFKDLSIFCFQVPYLFLQQANLLKIELSTGGRKNKRVQARVRRNMRERKRKRDDKESSSDVDEEEGEEELEEDKEESFGELAQDVADVSETPLNSAEEGNIELEVLLNCEHGCKSVTPFSDSEESNHECETSGRNSPILIDLDDDE